MRRKILIILLLTIGFYVIMAENSIRIVSYNVENLFRTPDTTRHWTHTKYRNKIEKISRVITNIGAIGQDTTDFYSWQPPAIVGLQEIENDSCLIDLCRRMRTYHYSYIHYDSPDHRGIDVGLLYDTTQFRVLYSEPLRVPLDSLTTTRDILYVRGTIINPPLSEASPFSKASPLINDTLHILLCHLPSMLGGRAASQWKRDSALSIIRQQIEKIGYDSDIVIMGDFNDDKSQVTGMHNLLRLQNKQAYTHKYQGIWAQLDYFWLSDSLIKKANAHIFDAHWLLEEDTKYLGTKPRRTYNGWHYNPEGYSDHLPIYLDLTFY